MKKNIRSKKYLTDIDRDAYDGPGQVSSLGRKHGQLVSIK